MAGRRCGDGAGLLAALAALAVLAGGALPASAEPWTTDQDRACKEILGSCRAPVKGEWSRLCQGVGDPGVIDLAEADTKKTRACAFVKLALVDILPEPARRKPDRTVAALISMPPRAGGTQTAGTPTQLDPVASVEPVPFAAGTVAVGTEQRGSRLVGTVSVNPASLAAEDPGRACVAQRLTDVTLSVPGGLLGREGDPGPASVRVRFNAAPLIEQETCANLDGGLARYGEELGALGETLEQLLRGAHDLTSCAKGLQDRSTSHCGAAPGSLPSLERLDTARVEEAERDARDGLARLRRQADSYYLGLDLRGDFGDPTGDEVEGDDGFSISAALAAGRRFEMGDTKALQLRLRAGLQGRSLTDPPEGRAETTTVSAEWGAAAVLEWTPPATLPVQAQWLGVGVGCEGRHTSYAQLDRPPDEGTGIADQAPVDTNYIDCRLMVAVPTDSGEDVTVGVTWPAWQAVGSVHPSAASFTISGDWGLLLPGE